jgi:hypothetical protein
MKLSMDKRVKLFKALRDTNQEVPLSKTVKKELTNLVGMVDDEERKYRDISEKLNQNQRLMDLAKKN